MTAYQLAPELNRRPHDFQTKPKRVHLIGIGGVAMTALAGLLKDTGHLVSGSDVGIYPPMSDLLREMEISVSEGYGPESLPLETDLVVVGNVVTRHFPVLQTLAERKIPYLSLPQAMSEIFLNQTRNLVVCGCHGKTTTTALAAKIWETAGLNPGFLIGGASLDFPRPWRGAQRDWFIIEGDEYDSAFFNKVPKFLHYRPSTVILTSIEFDHADIYPDLKAVITAFEDLMAIIPADGRLVAWGDSPLVRQVAAKCESAVEFYGLGEENDWQIHGLEEKGLTTSFELTGPEGFYTRLSLPRPGVYNALNAVAAAAAFISQGGDGRCLALALADFKGVKRRQQWLGNFGGIELVDDFAHHPTAVAETLRAIRAAYPGRKILTAFEPRSNTSRRAVFQADYARSLALADKLFLRQPSDPQKAPEGDRLDIERLAAETGSDACVFDDGQSLGRAIVHDARPGDVVLVMSNGSFDGLIQYLKENLDGNA